MFHLVAGEVDVAAIKKLLIEVKSIYITDKYEKDHLFN